MPSIMIKMVLNETLNNMNVMIVPNVLWNINEWTSIQNKKKIMKNYNWEYFKDKINKKFSELKQKTIYSQRKFDVEPVFGFMKAILCYTRMSVRGINKAKRELGFVLMALDIRKVTAQRAENNQKFIKKTISIFFNRNYPYLLILELYVPAYLMLDDIV